MNIYLKLEILARELEGRLLLGLVAAERGHTVLLGDVRPLLDPRVRVPPGVYHDKSLTPKPSKLALFERLRSAGIAVTSQDEEHGLLDEYGTYADFASMRFSDASLAHAAAAFMWGPHDERELRGLHRAHEAHIVATGSPRADLWRPSFTDFHRTADLPGIDSSRPFVLFAGYASMVLDRNPFATRVADQRPTYFDGADDPKEWRFYANCATEVAYLGHLVRAIRHASVRHPQAQLVVRPHPVEADGAWESLLGPLPNVIVDRRGSLGGWLRSASVVVHNGSTVGLEAAASGVPIISYQPNGERANWVSNRLSRTAADQGELLDLIDLALEGREPEGGWSSTAARALLADRLEPLEGPLSADRIVDAWERLPELDGTSAPVPRRAWLIGSAHRTVSRMRAASAENAMPRFTTTHKFPPLGRSQVADIHRRFVAALNRFATVRIDRIGSRLVRLRSL